MSEESQLERVKAISQQVTSEVLAFLKENDITQVELAQWVGVDRHNINKILHNGQDMTISRIVSFMAFAGMRVTVKFEDLDDPNEGYVWWEQDLLSV